MAKRKYYLAVWVRGEKWDWSDATLLSARPWTTSRGRAPEFETMRRELGRLFPGRTVHSPLEKAAPGATIVAIFSAEDPAGRARVGGQGALYQWAVDPP